MPKAPNMKHEDEPDHSPPQTDTQPPRQEGASRPQTFGEKAVGLSFNPSGDATVDEIKNLYAQIIDICHARRQSLMAGSETHRLWGVAITEAQTAQMWSVKAATWKD